MISHLVVGFLEINGSRFEAEASTTFSTGTWNEADGIVAGLGRGGTLHTDGYLEFRV